MQIAPGNGDAYSAGIETTRPARRQIHSEAKLTQLHVARIVDVRLGYRENVLEVLLRRHVDRIGLARIDVDSVDNDSWVIPIHLASPQRLLRDT